MQTGQNKSRAALQLALVPLQRGKCCSKRGERLLQGSHLPSPGQQGTGLTVEELAAERAQLQESQPCECPGAAPRSTALELRLLPGRGCGHEGAWVGPGSGRDMKLCPSIGRAGRATLPLSNDTSYELSLTGRSAHVCYLCQN